MALSYLNKFHEIVESLQEALNWCLRLIDSSECTLEF